MTMKLHKETSGTYTIQDSEGAIMGMIQGDEHYTGKPRRFWRISFNGYFNQARTLKEARQWVGV